MLLVPRSTPWSGCRCAARGGIAATVRGHDEIPAPKDAARREWPTFSNTALRKLSVRTPPNRAPAVSQNQHRRPGPRRLSPLIASTTALYANGIASVIALREDHRHRNNDARRSSISPWAITRQKPPQHRELTLVGSVSVGAGSLALHVGTAVPLSNGCDEPIGTVGFVGGYRLASNESEMGLAFSSSPSLAAADGSAACTPVATMPTRTRAVRQWPPPATPRHWQATISIFRRRCRVPGQQGPCAPRTTIRVRASRRRGKRDRYRRLNSQIS